MIEQLDLVCTTFLWIFAGVISAALATLLVTEYSSQPDVYVGELFGDTRVSRTAASQLASAYSSPQLGGSSGGDMYAIEFRSC